MSVNWISFADEAPPLGQRVMLTGPIEDHALPEGSHVTTDDFAQAMLEEPRTYRRWLAHATGQPGMYGVVQYIDTNNRILPKADYWCRIQSPDTLSWAK